MEAIRIRWTKRLVLAAALLAMLCSGAQAKILGVQGPNITLTAKDGYIYAGDGNTIYVWGYANGGGVMQYPGPTLIVTQGQPVSVTLNNELTVPVSIVFPGHAVTAAGGSQGLIAMEAAPGGSVTYNFTPLEPGTYMYHSGTDPALQIEMGLLGALIVRPSDFNVNDPALRKAYNHPDTAYDYEYLYLHSEMDHRIHEQVEQNIINAVDYATGVDNTEYFPYYWFYNGRTAPDVWAADGAPWLPNQPYKCSPLIHPGEKMLLRIIGTGRDPHPFHHHGNNGVIIARDGRLLESAPGAGPDIGVSRFTETVLPGGAQDVMFDPWTGNELGWDINGHTVDDPLSQHDTIGESPLAANLSTAGSDLTVADDSVFPHNRPFRAILWHTAAGTLNADANREIMVLRRDHSAPGKFYIMKRGADYEGTAPADWNSGDGIMVTATWHGRAFPVNLPDQKDLTFGFMYSGSPFLGAMGALPPGEGGFNVNNGLAFMFHSHNEKEMTNNDIFPGGMMSMMIVEPEGTIIEHSPF